MSEKNVTSTGDAADHDQQLEAVIAEFLRARDAGAAPDPQVILDQHPELAGDLRDFFSNHDRMNQLAKPFDPSTPAHEQPTIIRPEGDLPSETDQAGQRIGPYSLVKKLGEGGMGEVWLARQSEPVNRDVALKLIKSGMNSKDVLSRFDQERQALALMDHPNIAKVFDGGVTPEGQPYFVMELVNGLTLTKYCDEARLTPRERMELFVPICQAVQHAHQKGIVHRDLKPSNILVTTYDGRPVPKVIDFGVAKATGAKLTDDAMATQFGAVVGTLEYMSPEQAGYSGFDIDTRADIYSLGVILYELLTGLRPIEASRLRRAALHEMVRIIQEEEPQRPSTRLSSSDSLPSLAASRQIEPKQLTALLRGELDWVVMKCLEKQRDRRYETANALSRDLQRYLADEPVEARPPSASYRFRKFLRRNTGAVIATCLLFLTLLGGFVGTTLGLFEAQHQESLALKAAANETKARKDEQVQRELAEKNEQKAVAERDRADDEKRIAQAVRDFLQRKLLRLADPWEQADALLVAGRTAGVTTSNPTIRELLDRAAEELTPEAIETQFPKQPLVQAEILSTIGNAYHGIGEYGAAIGHLERSRDIHITRLGSDHMDTLTTLNNLARGYLAAVRLPEAIKLFEQVRVAFENKFGIDHPNTLTILNNLGAAYAKAGRLQDAIKVLEQVRVVREQKFGRDDPVTLDTLTNLAGVYKDAGNLSEAIALYERVRTCSEKSLGISHPATLTHLQNLATAYTNVGMTANAIELLEQARDDFEKKIGLDHPNTLSMLGNLALAYQAAGKLPEAIQLLEQVRDAKEKKLGADHPDTLGAINNLAGAYLKVGRLADVIKLVEQVHQAFIEKFGADHPSTLTVLGNLAAVYREAGKLTEAIRLFEQVRELQEKKLGIDHPSTLTTLGNLGLAYRGAGKLNESISVLEQVRDASIKKLGPDHPETLNAQHYLAGSYRDAARMPQAIQLFEQVREARTRTLGPDHHDTLTTVTNLAGIYRSIGRLDEAIRMSEQLLNSQEQRLGRDHPDTLTAINNLAAAYWTAKRLTESVPMFERALPLSRLILGDNHPRTGSVAMNLAVNYRDAGRSTDAAKVLDEWLPRQRVLLNAGDSAAPFAFQAAVAIYETDRQLAKAEQLYRELVEYWKRKSGPESPQSIGLLAALGLNLLLQEKSADAEPVLRECLKNRESTQPKVWSTFNTKSMLGGALLGQKKFADAEPLLRDGYEGMKQREATMPPQAKPRLTEAIQRLVDLYTGWDKPEQAVEWRQKLELVKESLKK